LNYAISGYDVWSYHLFNIIIHILAGLTLFGIVRRTLLSNRLRTQFGAHASFLAFATAAIWLVHPLQTQSVTYIIQRGESLMGLFYLLTLYTAIRSMNSIRPKIWAAVSVICCGLGMLTKEVMVTAPVIILLYDRAFFSGSFLSALRRRWLLYAFLSGTWLVLAGAMWWGQDMNSIGFNIGISVKDYALSQFGVILHYLRLCIWPTGLCLDYGWPIAKSITAILPSMLFIAAVILVMLWGLVLNRRWSYPLTWSFGILTPTSSIIPVADLAFEHRMYLPLAGVVVLVVTLGYILWSNLAKRLLIDNQEPAYLLKRGFFNRIGGVFIIIVVGVLMMATFRRNKDYQNPVLLWQKVVETVPDNVRGYFNLGDAYRNEGRFEEAASCYLRVLEKNPNYVKAHISLGTVFHLQGRLDEAIVHYLKATELQPKNAGAHYNLGVALQSQGKLDEAQRSLRRALQINPDFIDAHYNLGRVLLTQGKFEEAISHLKQVVEKAGDDVNAIYYLGTALQSQGRIDEAMKCFRKAVQLDPNHIPSRQALTQLLKNAK
jgi:Flp pilus assembly protein TadD